jgi:hypothetical protein
MHITVQHIKIVSLDSVIKIMDKVIVQQIHVLILYHLNTHIVMVYLVNIKQIVIVTFVIITIISEDVLIMSV